jgi:hypothetical protein
MLYDNHSIYDLHIHLDRTRPEHMDLLFTLNQTST